MGKVVVSEFVTLDGVFEDPGGAEKTPGGGWAFKFERGPEGDKFKFDELMAADVMLLGRVTYSGFAQAWPSMSDPDGFAEKMNTMPKYVVSNTLTEAEWNNSTVIPGDELEARVTGLRDAHGGDVLVAGSGSIARWLADHGQVDELRLMVYPVALGTGRRLFEGAAPTSFRIKSAETAGDCVVLTYESAPSA